LIAADAPSLAVAWDVLRPAAAAAEPTEDLVVGVAIDPYWTPHDPVITAAVQAAAAALANVATLVEVATPNIAELAASYAPIVGSEAYATHARWLAERPGDYQPATAERLRAFADLPAADYVAAQRTRRRLATELWGYLRAAGVDVLLTATTPLRATPIGTRKVDVGAAQVSVVPALLSLTQPFNLTGWPAVSVPGAVTDEGLPAGVQLVGVGVGEAELLRLAAVAQPATPAAGPA
jgi:aspartyl-tRNA(Asn)/glutamyl-tRNA(Gln) amidotransferase subunit A